jgi:hypothetical protein
MLNLDVNLLIPAYVSFTFVDEDAVLLNLHTNQYFLLDEVGARFWCLVQDGKSARETYQALLEDYEVNPAQLEKDLLELLQNMKEQGLVEIVQA